MARLPVLLLLVFAAFRPFGNAQQTYSSLPFNYGVKLSYPDADEVCSEPACIPTVSVPDGDSITISYAPLVSADLNNSSTITIFECFDLASTTDRPWRKPKDVISDDGQCSSIVSGMPPEGTYSYTPDVNTAPASYFIQVLEMCVDGLYCGKGRSAGVYTIIPIDSRPGWLIALVAVFCCVGPVSLVAFFAGEKYLKKNK